MPFQSNIKKVAQILNASVFGGSNNREVVGVTTDSRELKEKGMLFFARRGESTDGHKFLEQGITNNVAGCVVEENWFSESGAEFLKANTDACLVVVKDSTKAFGLLAAYWRTQLTDCPVICVTGSNGKTTCKEMIKGLLTSLVGPGIASEKSFNNHIGLPQTILLADKKAKWLLLEAGMNHVGELDYLGEIAKPDLAIILNIGPAHLGHFASLDEIADAKCELLAHVKDKGVVLINGDDQVLVSGLERLEKRIKRKLNCKTFGKSPGMMYQATDAVLLGAVGTRFSMVHGDERETVNIPHVGLHQVMNATAAAASINLLFPEINLKMISSAFSTAGQAKMRFEMRNCSWGLLIDDAYNANPVSMRAAIETAAVLADGKSLSLIIGDMRELGQHAEEYHEKAGEIAARSGAKMLIAIGEFAPVVVAAAKKAGLDNAVVASKHEEVATIFLSSLNTKPQVLLVKGSRGMELEKVVQLILAAEKN